MRERLTTATVVVERLSALGDGVTGQPHIHQARKPRAYVLTRHNHTHTERLANDTAPHRTRGAVSLNINRLTGKIRYPLSKLQGATSDYRAQNEKILGPISYG